MIYLTKDDKKFIGKTYQSCLRKKRFTEEKARKTITRMCIQKVFNFETLSVYYCSNCKFYHIGNSKY